MEFPEQVPRPLHTLSEGKPNTCTSRSLYICTHIMFSKTTRRNRHIHIYVYIHVYIYIYIHVLMYTTMCIHVLPADRPGREQAHNPQGGSVEVANGHHFEGLAGQVPCLN